MILTNIEVLLDKLRLTAHSCTSYIQFSNQSLKIQVFLQGKVLMTSINSRWMEFFSEEDSDEVYTEEHSDQ